MEGPCGDILNWRQAIGGAELAEGVGSPSQKFSIRIEGIAVDEASGDGDGGGQFRGSGADFASPNHEFTGRSRKLPQRTDSQDINAGPFGFALKGALQLSLQCVTTGIWAFDAEKNQVHIGLAGQGLAVPVPLVGGVIGEDGDVGGVGRGASVRRGIVGDDRDVGLEREGFE